MKGREILEQHFVARAVGRVIVDLTDLQQREIALAILGRTDQAGYRVAGTEVEAPDLAGRNIDVVGAGKVRTVGRAQEAEAVLQDLEHAIAIDALAVAGVGLQDREDDVLLARTRDTFKTH